MSVPSGAWPSLDDYQTAVIHPERNLKDPRLRRAQVETRSLGALRLPYPRSGNFGAVYKLAGQGETFALKVFNRAQPDRELRYRLIDEHLDRQRPASGLVTFHYETEGILVKGRWYPTLLMAWAEGLPLDHYLAEMLEKKGEVDNRLLCEAWVEVVESLVERRVAHGDLQHGNILVLSDGTLKLVDYDGMFVPSMRERRLTASEIGLPSYQHPKRYRGYFDERLDDYAALVILLSLACVDRGRWDRYHTDDNCLVVRESDLLRPGESSLLGELLGLGGRCGSWRCW